MDLCFVTNNVHKFNELEQLVGKKIKLKSLKDIGCNDIIPETGNTLKENSYEKAIFVKNKFSINCFSDDTGLFVDALGGLPGVNTARYAGVPVNTSKNMAFLLKNLEGVVNRSAHFQTVITLLINTNSPVFFDGIIAGKIADKPCGDKGFGYDSLFIPHNYNTTFAEMNSTEKNKVSHRAKATQKLISFLHNLT